MRKFRFFPLQKKEGGVFKKKGRGKKGRGTFFLKRIDYGRNTVALRSHSGRIPVALRSQYGRITIALRSHHSCYTVAKRSQYVRNTDALRSQYGSVEKKYGNNTETYWKTSENISEVVQKISKKHTYVPGKRRH